jgi:L-glyceraldehyde 3-phosphate reductase
MDFSKTRYDSMLYRRCGRSGLKLPAISLGCWHNFGGHANHDEARKMLHRAFDLGITHFDLANNYGPPGGSAEEFVGKTLAQDFKGYRDELIISTKAGYYMWPGPYGEWGSRKYLLASLNQSLDRLGLDYVDIYYSHRPDNDTPLEETIGALDSAVRQGKALYVGISSYNGAMTEAAMKIAHELRTPLIIHQPAYSMLNRWVEPDVLPQTRRFGLGVIAFCPLSQGLLTDKYLKGIPKDSRAASADGFLRPKDVTPEAVAKVQKLSEIAQRRGQTMAQMALAWVLRDDAVTSALIGASRVKQIDDNVAALANLKFSPDELQEIDQILDRIPAG